MDNDVIEIERVYNKKSKYEDVSDIELINLIVHELDKEKSDSIPKSNLSNNCAPIVYLSKKFIKRVKERYYKCNPIYGTFNDDKKSFPYQTLVENYLYFDEEFVNYSHKSMELLEKSIRNTQGTGGYMVFAHYKIKQGEFLCVLMLHSTTGFNINESLQLEELANLDIEKLDIASFINVDKWRTKSDEESYLSFLSGRKNVTEYFKEFVGCTTQKSTKVASKSFYKALEEYLITTEYEDGLKDKLRNQVYEYCDARIKKKEDIHLGYVSSILNPEEPDDFKDFASQETYQVSQVFRGNREVLKGLKFVNYDSDDLKLQFNKKLIKSKTIIYNKNKNELLIKKLPDDLREILNQNIK